MEYKSFKDCFTQEEIGQIQKNNIQTLLTHPKVLTALETLWRYNYKQIGFEYIAINIFECIRSAEGKSDEAVFQEITRKYKDPVFLEHCKDTRMKKVKMSFTYDCIVPYLHTAKSFLDFGCGRLALIRRLVQENTSLQHLYGFDPKSNPSNLGIDPRVAFIDSLNQVEKLQNIDIVFTSFVFHHLTDQEIQNSLYTIQNILKENGLFIFLDETFALDDTSETHATVIDFLDSIHYERNKDIDEIFRTLTTQDKFLFIYLNDLLNNLKHMHYMPWTFQYHTMENWKQIFEQHNFTLLHHYDLGIVKSDRLKQGISGLMIIQKRSI